jgi:hypothetical protein
VGAPSLSLRFLERQGGVFDFVSADDPPRAFRRDLCNLARCTSLSHYAFRAKTTKLMSSDIHCSPPCGASRLAASFIRKASCR